MIVGGKGGVGKTVVSSLLGLLLTREGFKVGILDLDLNGPAVHLMLGIQKEKIMEGKHGILPSKKDGLKVMSIAFFIGERSAPLRGQNKSKIIDELLAITYWDKLDFLLIDTPPGTGDEILELGRRIKIPNGSLVVTTSSVLALSATSRLIQVLNMMNVPILGLVENMSREKSDIIANFASNNKTEHLGSLPFDPKLENSIGRPRLLEKTELAVHLRQTCIPAIEKFGLRGATNE
jgi:ATP-binding protein involved in chromosome partitioning